jgi:site-specific recombinase XerD
MRVKVETITPEWAIDVLEKHNPRNRKVSENTVQAYATDMRNGRWVLNHQGIAFDTAALARCGC